MCLTILFVGSIVQRLVIGPVRELAAATEGIANDEEWSPFHPIVRRSDEIGILGDRFASMAHLVAARVRRELEEPVQEISEIARRLGEIGLTPPA